MVPNITQKTLTLGTVTNNGKACANPIADYIGKSSSSIAVNCIDPVKGVFKVQTLDNSSLAGCLNFIIRCGECDSCGALPVTKCLCSKKEHCGPCEDCIGGICVSTCKKGQICVGGICTNCSTAADCPCNQECTQTGCACPPTTTLNPVNGCCDHCQSSSDCGPCNDCLIVNGIRTCVPRDCGSGVCNITLNKCVQCNVAGDCPKNEHCENNTCVCDPGFIRVGPFCIPAPKCTSDLDCSLVNSCTVCGSLGECVPLQLPPGEICVNGEPKEKCDCAAPSCSNPTHYCTAVNPVDCACVPCQGTCATGCVAPCFCDPISNKCIANTCPSTPCTSGIDCGPNCGCNLTTHACNPCQSLSCLTGECGNTPGCKCNGTSCVPSGCNNATCTTPFDCPLGCTCHQGKCISCDNFVCTGINNCAAQERCRCGTNAKCEGDPTASCSDSLTLDVNYDNCSLTGKLITSTCCSCSPLTLVVKGSISSQTNTHYILNLIAELRKGEFDGVNINANPLLDDLSNDNIAENEVPTAGIIGYQAYTTYAIYVNQGGNYVFTGNSVEGPQTGVAAYTGAGAQVSFPNASFKKIGIIEQADPSTQREVVSVEITFTQNSQLTCPNSCVYPAPKTIGTYEIFSNDDWEDFPISGVGNGKAVTVNANQGCRDPFFKWRKDGIIFRKKYIADISLNTYEDLLENPPVTELEGCHQYVLEVDCSCQKSINEVVAFCNPQDINFNLTNCGKTFTLTDFETCAPNQNVEFYIKGGTIDIKFLGSNPPLGQQFTSTTCVTQITFGQTCNPVCNKVYEVLCPELEASVTTACGPVTGYFTVTFGSNAQDQAGNLYPINHIEIGGYTLTSGNLSVMLLAGTYTATVHTESGCLPFEVTVTEYCCGAVSNMISRDCDGVVTCVTDPNATYYVGGVAQNDICAYVQNLALNASAVITVKKGSCPDVLITIPSLGSQCCGNYGATVTQLTVNTAILHLYNAGPSPSVIINPLGVTATPQLGNTYLLTGFNVGTPYTITINSLICGQFVVNWTPTECALNVTLTQDPAPGCNVLTATVNGQTCQCTAGEFHVQVTNVQDIGSNMVRLTYQTSIQQFDASPTAGEVFFTPYGGIPTGLGCINCAGTVDTPRPVAQQCLTDVSILASQIGTGSEGLEGLQIQVLVEDQNVAVHPDIASATVTIGGPGVTLAFPPTPTDLTGTAYFVGCCDFGSNPITVSVSIVGTNGLTYTGATVITSPAVLLNPGPREYILPSVCTAGSSQTLYSVLFQLQGLELEDNCTYHDVQQSFQLNTANLVVNPSANQELSLSPVDVNAKWVRFDWYEDNVFILRQFAATETELPINLVQQDKVYKVIATCNPCNDQDELDFCCIPTMGFTIIPFNAGVNVAITGIPGNYQLDVDGNIYNIVLTTSPVELYVQAVPVAFPSSTVIPVTLTATGTTCVVNDSFTTNPDVVPALLHVNCHPVNRTYDVLVTNALPSWMSAILSGAGSVAPNGVDILTSDEADPAQIEVTDPLTGGTSGSIDTAPPLACFSSQVPASSSNAAPSSSNAPPSSSALPPSSSGIVAPSSCGASVTITDATTACTYVLDVVNPDNGTNTSRITWPDDNFFITLEGKCTLTNSCEGELTSSVGSLVYTALTRRNVAGLVAGDVADSVNLFDGSSCQTIDISPGGHTAACGCVGCGPVSAADLTYNGSNGTAFANAIKQAIINGICVLNGAVNMVDYYIRSEFSAGELRVSLYNKKAPTGTLMLWSNLTGSACANPFRILRGGSPIVTTGTGSIHLHSNDLFTTGGGVYPCGPHVTACGSLTNNKTISLGLDDVNDYGTPGPVTTNAINGAPQSANCSVHELVAVLTGCVGTPNYTWSGPGTIYNDTQDTIYVTTAGVYTVNVGGCSSCGSLSDNETI